MAGRATLTTVPSRNTTPEPRTAAMITHRPCDVPYRIGAVSLMHPHPRRCQSGCVHDLGLEEQVLEVLGRWDRRLEVATAAWAELTGGEQQRREAELEADGESDE